MEYTEFLKSKHKRIVETGFDIEIENLNSILFPFQKFVVKRALKARRYAVFSGTGTGKTFMQLCWCDEVSKFTGKPVLLCAPLAVTGQTIESAETINLKVVKASFDKEHPHYAPIQIANYEQLENIDLSIYGGIALDEASIIKNHEGSYRNLIIDSFSQTPFKCVFTATPSPNDPMELGNYAEFLNIMSRSEMLAMYFVHDAGETQKWRLKGHCEDLFWDWVSTWAIMFQKPADIHFKQDGFDLPPLSFIEKKIETDNRNNGLLFNDIAVSATTFNQELRLTKVQRLSEVIDIVNNSKESFIIWIKQNEEGEYLRKLIPDAVEVKGSDTTEYKEEKLLGFAKNEFRVLITKIKIAGQGLNYQHCHNQVFPSLDFSFEGLFQGVRRSWRFKQEHPVNIYIVTTDTMTNVIHSIKTKEKQFEKMQEAMTKAVNKNLKKHTKMERKFEEFKTENCTVQLGDCVQLIKKIPDESIGFSVFSPPFASLYVYSDELEDMGNSKDYNEFMIAFKFLVKELHRVLWSGRLVAVHCMDLPIQKGKEGYIGLRDFSGLIREAFEAEGFIYHTRVCCWKNPVTEMQRTKALGLLHKQLKKDAAMSPVGIPDDILVFRKGGEHAHPVSLNLSVDLWQKWASPVWMDIDFGNTLNREEARDDKDERHIAPLSLDIIQRCIALWSNEGDTILSPFGGIGSEGYQAIKMKRKAILFELKKKYFEVACKNISAVENEKNQLAIAIEQ